MGLGAVDGAGGVGEIRPERERSRHQAGDPALGGVELGSRGGPRSSVGLEHADGHGGEVACEAGGVWAPEVSLIQEAHDATMDSPHAHERLAVGTWIEIDRHGEVVDAISLDVPGGWRTVRHEEC